jgi:hypothetical protein
LNYVMLMDEDGQKVNINSDGSINTVLTGSTAGSKEMLTVSNTVKTLTAATYGTHKKALLQVQDAPLRYWQTGDDPAADAGILAQIGDIICLDSADDIAHFKAIRTTTTDAKLACQYSS